MVHLFVSLSRKVLLWVSPVVLVFTLLQELASGPVAGLGHQGLKFGPESSLGFWPEVWPSTMLQTYLVSHADLLEVLESSSQ